MLYLSMYLIILYIVIGFAIDQLQDFITVHYWYDISTNEFIVSSQTDFGHSVQVCINELRMPGDGTAVGKKKELIVLHNQARVKKKSPVDVSRSREAYTALGLLITVCGRSVARET